MFESKKIIQRLLLLYIFLLPWSAVYIFDEKLLGGAKWQFGTGVIYATELLLWLIIIIFIGSRFNPPAGDSDFVLWPTLEKIKQKFRQPDYKSLITLALWLFIGWAGLSVFWSAEKSAGWYLWRHFLEAGCLFFILLLNSPGLKKISWAFALSGTAQALLSISQFLNQRIAGQKFLGLVERAPEQLGTLVVEAGDGRWLRSAGSFNDPNFLGGFLMLSLIFIFYLYAQAQHKKTLLILTAINCFGLFFTFSRGSWLVLIIGLLFLLMSHREKWRELSAPLSVLILSGLTLSFIFSPLISSRADLNNRLEQKSLQERSSQTQTAIKVFKQHFLIGVGLNNYTYDLYLADPGQPAYRYQEVENIYLLALSELGIVGLLIFLFLLSAIIYPAGKKKNYWETTLALSVLGLGLFYHYPISQYQGLVILFIILTLPLPNGKLEKISAP